MISNRKHFQITFPHVPEPVADVWKILISCLDHEKCLPLNFYVSQIVGHARGKKSENEISLATNEISDLIANRGLDGFSVNTGYSSRSVAYNLMHMSESGSQSVLDCRIEQKAKTPADWTTLIEGIMMQWPCIGGWQWTNLYRAWQWTSTLDRYRRVFGEPPVDSRIYLKKSSDPTRPDTEFIDVSLNPGRIKELLEGIYFMPTSEMWLGPHFWQYAKCTREDVIASDFFLDLRDTPHFLYLKSWPEPFSRPDGEQGRIQQKLWKLFFHEECEWPPGFGAICDDQIYGPPEMMFEY